MREQLGDDEVLLLVIAIGLAAMTVYRWVVSLIVAARFRARNWSLVAVTPLLGLLCYSTAI